MNKITAEEIYNRLLDSDKILEPAGQIKFFLGDLANVVRQRDIVGNIIIQKWFEGWLRKNGCAYAPNTDIPMPPDFYLDPDNKDKNLLAVKAFNLASSPGFDIADFCAYQEEIIKKPYLLHVKYLIFGYEMTDDGYVVIRQIWLKNVWEICRAMTNYPLNLLVKDDVIHTIRPATWYGKNTNFPVFECLEDFVSAIDHTVYLNPRTRDISGTWCSIFKNSYRSKYGKKLHIPRWIEIEDKYVKEKLNSLCTIV